MVQQQPSGPGAYVLALALTEPLAVAVAGGAAGSLAPGIYLYAGSARGPGGIRARVERHLRPAKRRHWHIDQVTSAAAEMAALGWPGGDECVLMDTIRGLEGAHVPIAGFGSSDCPRCAAHLARLDGAATVSGALDRLSRLMPPVGGAEQRWATG